MESTVIRFTASGTRTPDAAGFATRLGQNDGGRRRRPGWRTTTGPDPQAPARTAWRAGRNPSSSRRHRRLTYAGIEPTLPGRTGRGGRVELQRHRSAFEREGDRQDRDSGEAGRQGAHFTGRRTDQRQAHGLCQGIGRPGSRAHSARASDHGAFGARQADAAGSPRRSATADGDGTGRGSQLPFPDRQRRVTGIARPFPRSASSHSIPTGRPAGLLLPNGSPRQLSVSAQSFRARCARAAHQDRLEAHMNNPGTARPDI